MKEFKYHTFMLVYVVPATAILLWLATLVFISK